MNIPSRLICTFGSWIKVTKIRLGFLFSTQSGTLARKTFDTRTILHSSEPVLTIDFDTTC